MEPKSKVCAYPSSAFDVPALDEYWVIFVQDKYYNPGYNPDDPSEECKFLRPMFYWDEGVWEAAIRELVAENKNYRAGRVSAARVTTTVVVSIS